MKKTLNIISLIFISLFSTVSYFYISLIISGFVVSFVVRFVNRLLGPEIITTEKNLIIYLVIVIYAVTTLVIIPIILSILTGILLYVLHKKKLTKIKNSFALLQLLLFAYIIYKLPEFIDFITGPVAIFKDTNL